MIDPNLITTVQVGELPPENFNLTDNLPHEIGEELKRGTVQQLADVIGTYLGTSDSLAFNPETVSDGGTLPSTDSNEWMLVGKGTFSNVGGGSDIVTTEELNALTSNGSYWSLAVQIPINVELAGITQNIRSGYTETTPSEDAVFKTFAEIIGMIPGQQTTDEVLNNSDVQGSTSTDALNKLLTDSENAKSDFFIDVNGDIINAGIDNYRTEFGQEYLAHYQNLILAKSPAKIIWSGDSTTDNTDGFVSADFTLNALYGQSAKIKGVSNLTQLNNGHTGENSTNWKNTFLPLDLAGNPDLYIWRWGINDPYFDISLATFESNLRTGLATIRATKDQDELSILLMTPNTVSDEENGRDEKWLEQIKPIIRKAARDYQCGFIDTYSLWVDSRNGAGDLYMDIVATTPPSSIHPKDVFNTWIVSKIFDFTLPDVIVNKIMTYPHSETGAIFDKNLVVGGIDEDTYNIGADHKIVTIESGASGSSRVDLVSPNSGAVTFGSQTVRKAGLSNQETDLVFYYNVTNTGLTLVEIARFNGGSFGMGTPTPSGVAGVKNFNIFESGAGNSQFILEGNNGAQFVSILSGVGAGNLPSLFFNNGLRIAIASSKDATGYTELGRFLSTGLQLNSLSGTVDEIVLADLDGKLKKGGAAPTSGTYTPNLVAGSNMTALVLNSATYTIIGDIVTCRISVGFSTTASTTPTSFTATMPINKTTGSAVEVGNGTSITGALNSGTVNVRTTSNSILQADFNSGSSFGTGGKATIFVQYSVLY